VIRHCHHKTIILSSKELFETPLIILGMDKDKVILAGTTTQSTIVKEVKIDKDLLCEYEDFNYSVSTEKVVILM